jgi:tetraacyldisaccharide 4'-kinase
LRIRRAVEQIAPSVAWASCCHAPQSLLGSSGNTQPAQSLAGRRVAAFCGIGNPAGFRHTLDRCGCSIVAYREFPDHHHYTAADIEQLDQWAKSTDCETVLCTHKDLVKIAADALGGKPLLAVCVGMEFLEGQGEIEQLLQRLFAGRPQTAR